MHINEDFFKVMIFLCPVIIIQLLSITAITPIIQLPPVVSYHINTFQSVGVPTTSTQYHFQANHVSGPLGTTVGL